MSAFIVSKAHIDAMVQAGLTVRRGSGSYLRWRVGEVEWDSAAGLQAYSAACQAVTRELTHDQADRVGAMLWNENIRSVDHRYNEHTDREVYRFTASQVTSPVAILKAIDCYEYQTCEHDEWPTSEAHEFCAALRKAMIHALPGYDAAPWGVD